MIFDGWHFFRGFATARCCLDGASSDRTSVTPEQEAYVANNAVSIDQAYRHPAAWFRAVHANEFLVGFVMLRDPILLAPMPSSPEFSLWRFMIDRRYQGAGYGRGALSLVVEYARSRPGVRSVHTSYVKGPNSPLRFYQSFGFRHIGQTKPGGEVALVLDLP